MATYAAVAARGSPTETSNPSHPAVAPSKANPDSKNPPLKDTPPPAYGAQQGTFPVHPYPDGQPYPATSSNGGGHGGGGPGPNTAAADGSTANHMHYREPTWLRFIKALGTGVLIYLLASMLVESMYLAARWTVGHGKHRHSPSGDYRVPNDVSLHQCATHHNWKRSSVTSMQELDSLVANTTVDSGDYPYASYTSFDLPLSSTDDASMLFLSRGPWLTGQVNFVTSARQRQGQVSATVIVKYYKEEVREEVRACIVEREDGAQGFGIFTPQRKWDWDDHSHQVSYESMIVLPEASPFLMKYLETDTPNSSQKLDLDGSKIMFENVLLKGRNGHINVEKPLSARKVTIDDSNSPVRGHFNVTDVLKIDTSNARVEASITLVRVPELNNTPSVAINTSNGVLHSDILLMDTPSFKSNHPSYKIDTHTTNSLLEVSFTAAPIDSIVSFHGSTSNAQASGRLYEGYSGRYEVETRNANAELVVLCPGGIEDPPRKPKDLENPHEEEGQWDVERDAAVAQCKKGVSMVNEHVSSKGYKQGVVEWVPVDHDSLRKEKTWDSDVVLKTSNGRAILQI